MPGPRQAKNSPEIGAKCGPQAPTPRPRSGVQFGPPPKTPIVVAQPEKPAPVAREKPVRVKEKIGPHLIAKARELRDRYLEHVNNDPHALRAAGKYAVGRALTATTAVRTALPLLKAG